MCAEQKGHGHLFKKMLNESGPKPASSFLTKSRRMTYLALLPFISIGLANYAFVHLDWPFFLVSAIAIIFCTTQIAEVGASLCLPALIHAFFSFFSFSKTRSLYAEIPLSSTLRPWQASSRPRCSGVSYVTAWSCSLPRPISPCSMRSSFSTWSLPSTCATTWSQATPVSSPAARSSRPVPLSSTSLSSTSLTRAISAPPAS